MAETTPAQAATPEPQAGDGQQEPKQPDTVQQTPERSVAEYHEEIKALRAENAKWRKQYQDAQKAGEAAEQKRLAEQGEYKTLYEAAKAKADAASALQERLDAVLAQAQEANARRIAAIPEHMRSLVPEYDDALKLAAWLDANAVVFSRPAPPPLDGRAGGNGTPATVTDAEVLDFATRMRIDPAHVDRAKLAKLKR